MADELLTIPEAADYLKCCRSVIYEMLRKGALTRVKLGTVTRVPLQSLAAAAAKGHDERLRLLLTRARPEWAGLIRIYERSVVVRGVASFDGIGRSSQLSVDNKVTIILRGVKPRS